MSRLTGPTDGSPELRRRLADWLLAMADNKQLLGLRYAEWCTGAPELEADIAASAMAQFELGHARVLRGVLGDLPEDPRDESRDTDPTTWFSLPALDTPFADWTELVVANALIDMLLTFNLRSAMAGGYKPLTQRLRKVLAEEEYHSVHAGAWATRLSEGPDATVARLRTVVEETWPQCLAWFGPDGDNGLTVLYEAGALGDPVADLRDQYVSAATAVFAGASIALPGDLEIDWADWSDASRRHGTPRFEERCFEMVTGAKTRAMGVRD